MADIAANFMTDATFNAPGGLTPAFGTFSGDFETEGDSDWIAIRLTAGTAYTFMGQTETALGGDSFLALYDASGAELTRNDNTTGATTNSQVTFSAATTGIYYLSIADLFNLPG